LPARTREAQNAPLGEIDKNHWGCAFALRSQLAIALQESAHPYDRIASGRILYAYSPYGETTALGADEGNPIQYTARENDGTGLYYYRARYYDPVLKRFVSEDPIGLAGGVNMYAYVHAQPVNNTDPLGLKTLTDKAINKIAEDFGTGTAAAQFGRACGKYLCKMGQRAGSADSNTRDRWTLQLCEPATSLAPLARSISDPVLECMEVCNKIVNKCQQEEKSESPLFCPVS